MELDESHGRLEGDLEEHVDDSAAERRSMAEGQNWLAGQAGATVRIAAPGAGENLVVESEAGVTYLLDVSPEEVRFLVEGEDVVVLLGGEDEAGSRIVFLKLAGMADEADAPLLQLSGVDYDVDALLEMTLSLPETPAPLPQNPAGPPVETEGGADGATAKGSGATQYQDNLGETAVSEAIGVLTDVDAPSGATEVFSSGTVFNGLPLFVSDAPDAFVAPVTSPASGPSVEILSGQVVDGYIANATVFRDANGNGKLDDGEVFTTTDINGNFSLTGGKGPLVAVGGTDVSTGLAFEGVLKAPEGSTVITPLTTLVQQLVEDGTEAKAAESQVKKALGIDEKFDLNNTDPVSAAAGGDTEALKVVKAGIEVANTATQVKAAIEGAGGNDKEAASDAAYDAIAENIGEKGDNTDLGDSTQVAEVLNDAARNHQQNTGENPDFDANDVQNATNVIAATNTAIKSIVVDDNSEATEVLTDLAQVAKVAQGKGSDAIEQAVETNDDSADDSYDDATEIKTEADGEAVGDVDGADSLTEGADSFTGGEAGESFDGLGGDDTLFGAGGSDAISGSAGNDYIDGGADNDVLAGGAGNDTLLGGAGNDDIIGHSGSDSIDGGAGTDVVRYDADVSGFTFAGGPGGAILVTDTATGDTDTITNVESLTFGDTTVLMVGTGHPFASIQDAIDAADEGDVILVADGNYGPITIDKSLTLLAIGDAVTITGAGVADGAAVRIESGVDDVVLGGAANGFDIGTGNGDLTAVHVVGSNEDVVIEGNRIIGIAGHALLTGGKVNGLTVRGNDLSSEGPLAVVHSKGEASLGAANASSDVRFVDNTLTGGDQAGLLLGIEADDAVITGNTFNGEIASVGLLEVFGKSAVITGNDFNGDGFVPAIRDSNDNYDDGDLIAKNSFEGVAVPVLSPGAAVTIDADQLGDQVTSLDISSLSGVSATFASLGSLNEITTSVGQSIQLEGSQIVPISEADGTLAVTGGAAVNIVNVSLVLPNDGTAPAASNLLALEFPDQASKNSLIPENLTIDGSHAKAIAAFWIALDQSHVGAQDFLGLSIDTAFAYLANDYVRYLEAGGEALLDLVEVPAGQQQTLHDNLLGILNDSSIASRFTDLGEADPRTAAAKAFGDRPIHSGAVDDNGLYTDVTGVSSTIGWDFSHGVDYPNGLPAPFAVLDEANALVGTSETDFFYGGAGDDTMTGGEAGDTAVYSGSRLDFDISGDAGGLVTVSDGNTADGNEGRDKLDDFDLRFSDGTVKFGAVLQRGVPETTAGGGDENSDNFHPGTGDSNENFVIHDNTEAQIEVALRVSSEGDPEPKGLTYFVDTGGSAVTDGAGTTLFWKANWDFDYSIVDYGAADISESTYTISIVADFTDIHGNTTQKVMVFDPIDHRAFRNQDYYQDPTGETDGLQNSQNIGDYFDGYDPSAPGSYDLVLTVRDAKTGKVVGQTEVRVEVSANITVGENGIDTIQQAIDAANDGYTILVPAGTYGEDLTIDKQVTLIGAQSGIDPTGSAGRSGSETVINGNIVLTDAADRATIDGFTINKGTGDTGIKVDAGAIDVTIKNNVLNGGAIDDFSTETRGILNADMGANTGLTVSQNSISGWHTGFYLEDGAVKAVISGNDFSGNRVGLTIEEPDGQVVSDNSFTNNQLEGIHLGSGAGSGQVTLDGNTFAGNGGQPVGVYTDGNGIIVKSDATGTGGVLELQDGATDVELLGEGGLSVTGNSAANKITGNNGANTLNGAGGADTLAGGAGDDTLAGGADNDLIYGNGDHTIATFSTDFSEFAAGPITDGENGWTLNSTVNRDQEIVDLGGARGKVFRISSDPSSADFAGPYSPPVRNSSDEVETVGEPSTSADFDTIRLSYDFRAVSDTPDSSRIEVDFSRAGNGDRINFMILEWDASVGLRIATNEATTTNGQWYTNDYTAFTGNRTLVEGLDSDGAKWHTLEMVLRFKDGPDNDVIEFYLDGQLIGTSTTFENYWNWLKEDYGNWPKDHAANAEVNQAVGLFFRPSGSGAAEDGPGGQNQGFYFDNVEITATNSATDNDVLSGGAGDDTLFGGLGDDQLSGDGDADTLYGEDGNDTLSGGAGNDLIYGDGGDATATFSTNFSEFETGPITNGENDWILRSTYRRDQEIVDLGGERGKVFRMSSDPSSGDFAGPYSPPVTNSSGEVETVGEPSTSADFDTIRVSYDFRAVSDTPDSSRVEVDFGRADNGERINFVALEWEESVGLRIVANEPTTTNGEWYSNEFAAFTGYRTVADGLDRDGAKWHTLEMVLRFNDGPDNDVVEIYLDGQLIGTSTSFENYWNWLEDDHAANAELNQAVGLFFRPNALGAPSDGPGGENQGFYFDNVQITATNSADVDDVLNGGAGNDTLFGGAGNDLIYGDGDADILYGEDGKDTLFGGAGNDLIYGDLDADVLFGEDGNDTLFGGAGNDIILGGGDSDVLYGGGGNDTLVGGTGSDTIFGGAGGDVIAYEDLLDAGDLIDGFDATGTDKIDLDKLFDSLGVAEADRAGRVEIQQSATDGDATILIDSDPSTTGFETTLTTVVNVNGDLTVDDLVLMNS